MTKEELRRLRSKAVNEGAEACRNGTGYDKGPYAPHVLDSEATAKRKAVLDKAWRSGWHQQDFVSLCGGVPLTMMGLSSPSNSNRVCFRGKGKG